MQLKLKGQLDEEKRKMNLINIEDRGIVERILKRLKDKKDATNKYGNRKEIVFARPQQ